jgi:hypothetical protein
MSRLQVNCLGEFVAPTYRVQPWIWCQKTNKLLFLSSNKDMMDIYTNTACKMNRFVMSSMVYSVLWKRYNRKC